MQIVDTPLLFTGGMNVRRKTDKYVIHHTASADVSANTIHGWHLNRDWSGIGYHFVIRENGTIERGRPEDRIGAHAGTKGNPDSIAIVLTGNFEITKPTEAQMSSLVWLLKSYLFPKYGKKPVLGHKDIVATACPGKNFPWEDLRDRLEEEDVVVYKTVKDVPAWGKPIVEALVKRGSIAGDGKGSINVSEDLVKVLAILEREGVLKR